MVPNFPTYPINFCLNNDMIVNGIYTNENNIICAKNTISSRFDRPEIKIIYISIDFDRILNPLFFESVFHYSQNFHVESFD